MWLDSRLPFEPKGEQLVARNVLRKAIGSMRRQAGMIFAARYTSLDESFCDVENVLLYNVCAPAFTLVAGGGLRFERVHAAPPASPDGRQYRHHHRYCFVEDDGPRNADSVSSYMFTLSGLSTSSKPHEIWWAATGATGSSTARVYGPFELYVALGVPAPFGNLAGIVKPLLDGVICAMHPAIEIDDEAVRRLSAKTGWGVDAISARLLSPPHPVLARRHLLHSYRDFVKWDPADELCQRCTIVTFPASRGRLSVSITVSQMGVPTAVGGSL